MDYTDKTFSPSPSFNRILRLLSISITSLGLMVFFQKRIYLE